MKQILVTQRVDVIGDRAERRDALDQQWVELLRAADLQPVLVPNSMAWVATHLAHGAFDGLLLTGGNSMVACGGDAPERDEVEIKLLATALERKLPVLGICRGMQMILQHFGATLAPVTGHVCAVQTIAIEGVATVVNSYHDWGTTAAPSALEIWARAEDNMIKAVRHPVLPVCGIMWHPERISPFRADDVTLLRTILGQEVCS